MGCIGSRLALLRSRTLGSGRLHQARQNVFPVLNVDDIGRHISPGKLEVTETDLVLHIRGKPPLTWPLRCLRRYGYEEDLFSFESGRRCPTGAGIYAFKCNRAQSLFNLLQAKIQGNPTTFSLIASTPITPNTNNPTSVSPTFDYVNISESNLINSSRLSNADQDSMPRNTASSNVNNCTSSSIPHQSQDNNHPVYMNVESWKNTSSPAISSSVSTAAATNSYQNHMVATMQSSLPALPRHNNVVCCTNNETVLYQNSCSSSSNITKSTDLNCNPTTCTISNGHNSSCQNLQHQLHHQYCNSVVYTNVDCSPIATNKEINYVELDLESGTSSSKFPVRGGAKFHSLQQKQHSGAIKGGGEPLPPRTGPELKPKFKFGKSSSGGDPSASGISNVITNSSTATSNQSELGYATIDFDRTAALSVVTRSKIKLDFSSCRHKNGNEVGVRKTRHNSTAM